MRATGTKTRWRDRAPSSLVWTAGAFLALGWIGAGGTAAASMLPEGEGPTSSTDASGDVLGRRATQIDAVGLRVIADTRGFVVELELAPPFSAPDSGRTDAVVGFVDLDLDPGPTEDGVLPLADFADPRGAGSLRGIADDLHVPLDTYRRGDGAVDLVAEGTREVVARAPLLVTPSGLSLVLSRDLLASIATPAGVGASPLALGAAAVVGTRDEVTDVVPDRGFVANEEAVAGAAVLLADERFAVNLSWRNAEEASGEAGLVTRSNDSALFWFFDPDNWEAMVKVLDGCAVNGHWWVFAAAPTDLELTLAVTDTGTGATRSWSSPLGQPAITVTDTEAFASCP